MLGFLKNIIPWGNSPRPDRAQRSMPRRVVLARYDAAATTEENRRHWANADHLSASAANNPAVRRILRARSRYEVANNSYARGIVLTLANDCIGTGPRLQLLTDDDSGNRTVEQAFARWAEGVRLAEKLRTLRMARAESGEVFGMLMANPKVESPVKLDLRLIEADQVATPLTGLSTGVDGIVFDAFGNPLEYHVLRAHPGDGALSGDAGEFDRIAASAILHYFRVDRPGQIPSQNRPIRFGHDASSGVGHTDAIRVDGGHLVATGVVSRDTPAAKEIVVSSKNGFPWQASIGASVEEFEFVKETQKAIVNGRTFDGPVNVVRKATLGEISFVDLGADGNTSAQVAATSANPLPQENPLMDSTATASTPVPPTSASTDTSAALVPPAPAPASPTPVSAGPVSSTASPAPAPSVQAAAAPVTSVAQNLSGGQRQRIALARAFLKNSPVLILDEATSALDTINERQIQRSIEELKHDRTVIIVAHRLSTLQETDRILVFDQGLIVESGTYDELIESGGAFSDLVKHAERSPQSHHGPDINEGSVEVAVTH